MADAIWARMSSEVEKHIRTCATHGEVERVSVAEQGELRHEHLACGCTLEVKLPPVCVEGDAVLYTGVLYRVVEVQSGILTLRNDTTTAEAVPEMAVTHLGRDTLSLLGLDMLPKEVMQNDFVRHRKLGYVGQVLDVMALHVRVMVREHGDVVRIRPFVWHVGKIQVLKGQDIAALCTCQSDPHLYGCLFYKSVSRYFPSVGVASGNSSSVKKKKKTVSSSRPTSSRFERQRFVLEPEEISAPKPQHTISTAELIKEEVSSLEKQERANSAIRPLKTNAPTVKEDTDSPTESGPVGPLPKRRGDW